MATNYTWEFLNQTGREFYVLKTKASNIKLVNLYNEYGENKNIASTNYYGMNGSFLCLIVLIY